MRRLWIFAVLFGLIASSSKKSLIHAAAMEEEKWNALDRVLHRKNEEGPLNGLLPKYSTSFSAYIIPYGRDMKNGNIAWRVALRKLIKTYVFAGLPIIFPELYEILPDTAMSMAFIEAVLGLFLKDAFDERLESLGIWGFLLLLIFKFETVLLFLFHSVIVAFNDGIRLNAPSVVSVITADIIWGLILNNFLYKLI